MLRGGRCVLMEDRIPTAEGLGKMISEQGVTTSWLTASLYNTIIEEGSEGLKGIRQLVVGGEALSVKHIKKGKEELRGTELINGYGPTEGTTFSSSYAIEGEIEEGEGSIAIGRPISNTEIYIIGEGLEGVPIGVVGEICIGGDGLARGYHGRVEMTAERFIPDGLSYGAGGRLYRAGDKGRYRRDGVIEYVGRIDHQVKVRGHRIELGEVEAVLRQHGRVREAVVVASGEGAEKRLIAYVVGEEGVEGSERELRRYLKENVPEYMIPSVFVMVEKLPVNLNGKVDRSALPSPEVRRGVLGEGYVAPRTPIEEVLAEIWADLLRREGIGIYDNFFELGGHSLLAIQLRARIYRLFEVEIPLRSVFE